MQAFKLFFFIIIAFTCSCGRKVEAVKVKKIGIDKSFYPYVDISAYIIGFIDDLLMDFSKNSGYVLELVSSNMEDLMYDIENERLDAIISFNDISIDKLKTLEYSDIFLNTSFILITNENNKDDFYLSNTKVSIAIPYEECSTQLLQENPNIFLINYNNNYNNAMNDFLKRECDAVLIDKLRAAVFLKGNKYKNKLKIIKMKFKQQGLKCIINKKMKNQQFINSFNSIFKNQKLMKKLKEKWSLS